MVATPVPTNAQLVVEPAIRQLVESTNRLLLIAPATVVLPITEQLIVLAKYATTPIVTTEFSIAPIALTEFSTVPIATTEFSSVPVVVIFAVVLRLLTVNARFNAVFRFTTGATSRFLTIFILPTVVSILPVAVVILTFVAGLPIAVSNFTSGAVLPKHLDLVSVPVIPSMLKENQQFSLLVLTVLRKEQPHQL